MILTHELHCEDENKTCDKDKMAVITKFLSSENITLLKICSEFLHRACNSHDNVLNDIDMSNINLNRFQTLLKKVISR